jgi:hypothetical protein
MCAQETVMVMTEHIDKWVQRRCTGSSEYSLSQGSSTCSALQACQPAYRFGTAKGVGIFFMCQTFDISVGLISGACLSCTASNLAQIPKGGVILSEMLEDVIA